jgi:2-keto-4-pentenoate hydratase/2-oxohepta-3-ene-1,7-dioic acid hydratase in catechol pathway
VNIFYKNTGENKFFLKPDSALVKGSKDLYIPDNIEGVIYSPSLVFRINKSSKRTERRFARRYYNEVSYGINMYDYRFRQNSSSDFFDLVRLTFFDNSCYSGDEFFSLDKYEISGNINLAIDGVVALTCRISEDILEEANMAIELISGYCSMKSGDLIYIQLGEFAELRKDVRLALSHSKSEPAYSEEVLFDFRIK